MDRCEYRIKETYEELSYRKSLPIDDKSYLSDEKYMEALNKVPKSRDYRIKEAISSIKDLVEDYYEDSEDYQPSEILCLVGKELINLVESLEFGFLPYSSIPLKILAKYGAIDAVGTLELYNKLSERITNESTAEVDLWKGYKVIKSQLEVATSMEMAGLHWDDQVAQEEQDWFNDHACEAMRNMLLSGFLDENIFQAGKSLWVDYLLDNDKDELVNQLGFDYVLTDLGIKKFEDGKVKGREIRRRSIADLLPDEYWDSIKDLVIRYTKLQILDESKYTYFDEFKEFYNPASPGQHKVLNPILVTEDIKLAQILHSVYLILDDTNRDLEKDFRGNDLELFQLLRGFRVRNKEIEDWNEEHPDEKKPLISNKEIFESFRSFISRAKFRSSEINNLVIEGLKYELTSGDEPSMIEIYHLYQLLGYDIEDESTWDESFRFLY